MPNETIQNLSRYQPTKTVWFWSSVGVAALTMVVGFTAGGWVTSSTAAQQTETSSQQAVATLAATICANRFLTAPADQYQVTPPQAAKSCKQDHFIAKGSPT